ncbi:hypothetical protein CH063_09887 [Colletotrichum higginsianum]|uniref:Uncharacterized protein n=1 Tax=Colletotrichum higginsianum (strain IMI 349063) TaxID=759273 RepID=H1VFA9_COLHI|nr:hypothetical protein CH063_09887 [Colletotrichum higginsianum]
MLDEQGHDSTPVLIFESLRKPQICRMRRSRGSRHFERDVRCSLPFMYLRILPDANTTEKD